MKVRNKIIFGAVFALIAACGSDEKNGKRSDCEVVAVGDTSYCAWQQAIIVETGYECPEEFGFAHEFDNLVVCSEDPMTPGQEIVTQIETELAENANNENNEDLCALVDCSPGFSCIDGVCVEDSSDCPNGCPDGQACSIGACVTPCDTSADCSDGEACAPTIDGPVSWICTAGSCENVEAWYSQANGFAAACNTVADCRVENDNCGVGLGGCYLILGTNDDASHLNDLASWYSDNDCVSGVCDCDVAPQIDCVDNKCVSVE